MRRRQRTRRRRRQRRWIKISLSDILFSFGLVFYLTMSLSSSSSFQLSLYVYIGSVSLAISFSLFVFWGSDRTSFRYQCTFHFEKKKTKTRRSAESISSTRLTQWHRFLQRCERDPTRTPVSNRMEASNWELISLSLAGAKDADRWNKESRRRRRKLLFLASCRCVNDLNVTVCFYCVGLLFLSSITASI